MLTVYRASAGAGKTHKLTGEYLTLLFTGPGAFRRILAVTFTNKATDEMKTRIVDELYNLASGRKSDYVELLKSAYSLTEIQVRKQALLNSTATQILRLQIITESFITCRLI